jgi:hypothetical protein
MNFKKEVSPTVITIVLGVFILVIGYAAWRFFFTPSTLPPLPPELRPGAVGAGAPGPSK